MLKRVQNIKLPPVYFLKLLLGVQGGKNQSSLETTNAFCSTELLGIKTNVSMNFLMLIEKDLPQYCQLWVWFLP
jgi:hypothetical protein